MAGVSKASGVLGVRGMAAMVLIMMAAVVGARPAKVNDATCSTSDTYVYPYWSFCNAPAELSTGYQYLSARTSLGLAPEYDETNATYYVRLVEDGGATYVAVTESSESDTLLVNSTVFIYNSETQRVLTWREEGTDEYFLIEQEVSSVTSEAARFRFLLADSVSLPCPLIYPPVQCHAYYLVSDGLGASSSSSPSDSGLETYEESSVYYIKAASAGSTGNLPLVVARLSGRATSAMPFSKIRSVTARA